VLDVMMPKLTGYEVTQRIRANEATSDIPVILLTARVQEADVERGFEGGADDYLKKPFSPQELRARVQAVLGRAFEAPGRVLGSFIPLSHPNPAFWQLCSGIIGSVGCILILEPQPDIRELVRRVAVRLGHEAVMHVPSQDLEDPEIDAVVVEPEGYRALTLAQQLRDRSPDLPIICASIAPPNDRTRELRPVAHLQKPFTLEELQRALAAAVQAPSAGAA